MEQTYQTQSLLLRQKRELYLKKENEAIRNNQIYEVQKVLLRERRAQYLERETDRLDYSIEYTEPSEDIRVTNSQPIKIHNAFDSSGKKFFVNSKSPNGDNNYHTPSRGSPQQTWGSGTPVDQLIQLDPPTG